MSEKVPSILTKAKPGIGREHVPPTLLIRCFNGTFGISDPQMSPMADPPLARLR